MNKPTKKLILAQTDVNDEGIKRTNIYNKGYNKAIDDYEAWLDSQSLDTPEPVPTMDIMIEKIVANNEEIEEIETDSLRPWDIAAE